MCEDPNNKLQLDGLGTGVLEPLRLDPLPFIIANHQFYQKMTTLPVPETNIAPENGWLDSRNWVSAYFFGGGYARFMECI